VSSPRAAPVLITGTALGERGAQSLMGGQFGGEFVVAAAQVLHDCMSGHDGAGRGQAFESAHRPQPRAGTGSLPEPTSQTSS